MLDPIAQAKKIEEIKNYDGEDRIISSFDMVKIVETGSTDVTFMSGLPQLDRLIEGFEGGELVVISGKTGCGKTLMAQTLTKNLCKQRLYPLWFSYEMTARQFLNRFHKVPLFYMPMVLKERALDWIDSKVYGPG